ncbi:hypothetical protein WG66_011322 [Moniliophthora roreri]|nr:hypothetical protein WG66_011322 [Moniliophthora roreri]
MDERLSLKEKGWRTPLKRRTLRSSTEGHPRRHQDMPVGKVMFITLTPGRKMGCATYLFV